MYSTRESDFPFKYYLKERKKRLTYVSTDFMLTLRGLKPRPNALLRNSPCANRLNKRMHSVHSGMLIEIVQITHICLGNTQRKGNET
jgi:hypothetical protein